MKNIFFLFLTFNIYAQKIEKNDFFMKHWLMLGKEIEIISKDTLVLIKTLESEKLFSLKKSLSTSVPELSEILFMSNRLYFNPNNINCGCNNSKESFSWKWKFNYEEQIINIDAQGSKKNQFQILSLENVILNEIETKKLILVRI
mgnify:CR=1 FL=1